MAEKRCTKQSTTHASTKYLTVPLALAAIAAVAADIPEAVAQSNDGVSVNLGVLDDLDPMKTLPRLLMPSSRPTTGRIVLTPPAGVDAITPQRSRVVLRPPPGAPARAASAPKISVPPRAPAAPTPPTSVTAPPAPEPSQDVQQPAITSPVDQVARTESSGPTTQMSGPPTPAEVVTPEPEQSAEADQSEQVAALPEPSADAGPISISFGVEETELPSTAATALTSVVEQLKSDAELRVQLLAYASSADGSPSSVRRKSLSRALSVREFLMDQGVQSTRIEVRALGDQNENGAPDRVDAVVERR